MKSPKHVLEAHQGAVTAIAEQNLVKVSMYVCMCVHVLYRNDDLVYMLCAVFSELNEEKFISRSKEIRWGCILHVLVPITQFLSQPRSPPDLAHSLPLRSPPDLAHSLPLIVPRRPRAPCKMATTHSKSPPPHPPPPSHSRGPSSVPFRAPPSSPSLPLPPSSPSPLTYPLVPVASV